MIYSTSATPNDNMKPVRQSGWETSRVTTCHIQGMAPMEIFPIGVI